MAARGSGAKEEHSAIWTVPVLGTLRGMPPYKVPKEALYETRNVTVRNGRLEPRPGLTNHNATGLGSRVQGGFNTVSLAQGFVQLDAFQNDAFQTDANVPSTLLLAATKAKIWALFGGVWKDITGVALTNVADMNHSRFTGIQIGSTIFVLHTNGYDNPQQWDGVSATTVVVAGSPPKFTDWTTIADHVVGIVPPYDIRWGNSLAINTWPAGNTRSLSDTADRVVAIRNFGTLGGVVYKERTIWLLTPFGATEASFFRADLRGHYDGPASPAAVVDANGIHIYMTNTGRIGMFDGNRHDWIGDGILPLIEAEIDQANAGLIFGVYEPTFREVYFYYPRTADSGLVKGMAVVILPNPKAEIGDYICFHGQTSQAVSAGVDLRLGTKKALVFRADDFKSYTVEGANDAGTEFSGYWQTGMEPMPGLGLYRVEAMEVFAERGGGYGTLTVKPVSSFMLSDPMGTLGAGTTDDLSVVEPADDELGTDARGAFLGMRHEFTTPITLRWYASKLTGRKVE